MSAKAGFSCALVLTILGISAVRSQEPRVPPAGLDTAPPSDQSAVPAYGPGPSSGTQGIPPSMVPGTAGVPVIASQPSPAPPGVLSSWIIYPRTGGCCQAGGHGPIFSELYIRNGPNLPFGPGFFAHNLETGYVFEGGGRSLFFNSAVDAAWTVDLGLVYMYNHIGTGNNPVTLLTTDLGTGLQVPTTTLVRSLQRTYAGLTLGREVYLNAPADASGCKWRAGFDAGCRLGTEKADFDIIRHRTDVVWGPVAALHTDLEVPCGCCTYQAGFRLEWDYNVFEDLLQQHSELADINLLVTVGVRF